MCVLGSRGSKGTRTGRSGPLKRPSGSSLATRTLPRYSTRRRARNTSRRLCTEAVLSSLLSNILARMSLPGGGLPSGTLGCRPGFSRSTRSRGEGWRPWKKGPWTHRPAGQAVTEALREPARRESRGAPVMVLRENDLHVPRQAIRLPPVTRGGPRSGRRPLQELRHDDEARNHGSQFAGPRAE